MRKIFYFIYLHLFHKQKVKRNAADLYKLLDVVLSCQSEWHCKTAFFYLDRYMLMTGLKGEQKNAFSFVQKIIIDHVMMYLQDTMDHDRRGFHYSQVKGYQTTNTWPDLNDYVGVLLDIQFPKMWTRGNLIIRRVENGNPA